MHFVFTVCDSAAGESCPIWPGHPTTAHWGIPDPAAVDGSANDKQAAFARAYRQLQERIERFLELPLESLDRESLRRELSDIGGQ
jgi:arsenate reductase